METKSPIQIAIDEKESALLKAKSDVNELESAIAMLKNTLRAMQPTAYEQSLSARIAAEKNYVNTEQSLTERIQTITVAAEASSAQRFKDLLVVEPTILSLKGLRGAIVSVLSDDKARSIDQILKAVNITMSKPTTRPSVRATLGFMKAEKLISNPSYGFYSSIKSEKASAVTDAFSDNNQASVSAGNTTQVLV
jgi:hypothetical protein